MGESGRVDGRAADARRRTRAHWLAVGLAAALGTLNVALGLAVAETEFLVVGIGFYLGVMLFSSSYWKPILYVGAALYTLALGVLWVLGGMQYPLAGALAGLLGVAFVGVALVLFFRDRSSMRRARG